MSRLVARKANPSDAIPKDANRPHTKNGNPENFETGFRHAMSTHPENESWIVECGALIIEKVARSGVTSLNDWERLVYLLWEADYMMRNAGDFANADDMCPEFQTDATRLARQLSLPASCEAFSLPQRSLQSEYFARFEAICNEIRSAEPPPASKS